MSNGRRRDDDDDDGEECERASERAVSKRNKTWCELVIYYHAISVMKFSNNFSVQSERENMGKGSRQEWDKELSGTREREGRVMAQDGVCRHTCVKRTDDPLLEV